MFAIRVRGRYQVFASVKDPLLSQDMVGHARDYRLLFQVGEIGRGVGDKRGGYAGSVAAARGRARHDLRGGRGRRVRRDESRAGYVPVVVRGMEEGGRFPRVASDLAQAFENTCGGIERVVHQEGGGAAIHAGDSGFIGPDSLEGQVSRAVSEDEEEGLVVAAAAVVVVVAGPSSNYGSGDAGATFIVRLALGTASSWFFSFLSSVSLFVFVFPLFPPVARLLALFEVRVQEQRPKGVLGAQCGDERPGSDEQPSVRTMN